MSILKNLSEFAESNSPITIDGGKIQIDKIDLLCLMTTPNAQGFDSSPKLKLKKLASVCDYNPIEGYLLSDVTMIYDTKNMVINIVGDRYFVFKPSGLCSSIAFCKKSDLETVIHKENDILFSLGKFVFLKNKYYFKKDAQQLKRCYINTPVEIIDCILDV